MVRAVEWLDTPEPRIRLIDQTLLPLRESYLDVTTVDTLIKAIAELAVRGAPALGAVGALGVAVARNEAVRQGWDADRLEREIDRIRDARPTAVNLAWGVNQVRDAETTEEVVRRAYELIRADEEANRTLSRLGADWIENHLARERFRIVTHCNSGALATTAWGTAYGIIHELHDRGKVELVYADETRPLLQGARLTSWELTQDGIPHVVQADGAASSTILRGRADFAVIGADRITANADAANKVGSLALALACQRRGIPFLVAAPFSTVDLATARGDDIVIEERAEEEVLFFAGVRVTPPTARGFNPAFDVTPHDLISAVVTERGIVEPATAPHPDLMASLVP